MAQVEELKKEREQLEKDFNSATVDMQSKFLQALGAEGTLDAQRISDDNLKETFGELKGRVEETAKNQEALMEEITVSGCD